MNIKWNSIIIILITVIGVKFIIDYEGTSAINIDDLNIDVCINDCYEDNEDIISELNRIIALVEEEIEKTSTDENVCIGELNSGITSITKDCIIEHPENGNMGPAVLRSILEKMNYVVSELLTCNEFENCEQTQSTRSPIDEGRGYWESVFCIEGTYLASHASPTHSLAKETCARLKSKGDSLARHDEDVWLLFL